MKIFAYVTAGLIAASSFACGGSSEGVAPDETEGALEQGAEPKTTDVEMVVKATDSKEAKAFLSQFVRGFREIVKIDRRDGVRGASSNEDLEENLYKTKRGDGTIECTDTEACTFKLTRVRIVDGKPVSEGNSNTWGGQLFSIFVGHSGSALGGNQATNDAVVIGKKGTVPSIECHRVGADRGLETDACSFNLKR